jgi:hypothetical protein
VKALARILPVVLAVVVAVVGGMELVSRAQSGDLSGASASSVGPSLPVSPVTTQQFQNAGNQICLTMVNQLNAAYSSFTSAVTQASATVPANQNDAATGPLDGTTTTLPGLSSSTGTAFGLGSGTAGASGQSSSSTTAATVPSGSYDVLPVKPNPLTVVNQLLNDYMDQLDAIVGMQNDVLSELETLSEPPNDEPVLQQIWVAMTEAAVAQSQADVVLENIVSDYYAAGYMASVNSLNGAQPNTLNAAEQKVLSSSVFTQDLIELTGGINSSTPAPGSLEGNLAQLAGNADAMIGAYGLNECEIAGLDFQNFQSIAGQSLAGSLPNIAQTYINDYVQQSQAGQPISLVSILSNLPQFSTTNMTFSGSPSATVP